MNRTDRRMILLALGLAGLAGMVDALGYLTLHGFFVSFMSGNSTRLSVGLAQGTHRVVGVAGGLIGLFVSGVTAGELLDRALGRRRSRLLGAVALMLTLAATAASLGLSATAIALATLALGAENAVLKRVGAITIGATYMTGTLVKLGSAVAAALGGGPRWDWLPYLLMWLSLATGSVIGALLFPWLGLRGLWLAAAWCALLAALVTAAGRQSPQVDRE